jgi:ankyrin repeat protein
MEKMCIEVNRCAENDCRGEDVSRLSSIPELALRETMQIIAKEGRISQLLEINKMDMDFFVDIYSSEKITPLMTALESKQLEVTKLLLEMKADPNHESLNDLRPLEILVSKYHDKEIFKNALDLLMKHNADIHYKNANGENLLFSAVKANNREAVEVLLALGVDPNLKNTQGKTAAEVAKRLGHRSLRNILYYWPRVLSAN